jgi:hypothetical protein
MTDFKKKRVSIPNLGNPNLTLKGKINNHPFLSNNMSKASPYVSLNMEDSATLMMPSLSNSIQSPLSTIRMGASTDIYDLSLLNKASIGLPNINMN